MLSKELRNLNINEVENLVKEKRSEIIEMSKKIAKGSEKNVKKIKQLKKELARILTVLNEMKVITEVESLKNE